MPTSRTVRAVRFAIYLARYAVKLPAYPFMSRREVFRDIHKRGVWRTPETDSGAGSTLESTQSVRDALPRIIRKLKTRTILDIPCGDFHWMSHVDTRDVRLVAADIVPELVEGNRQRHPDIDFRVLDACSSNLPQTDMIFCRDCLVHLSLKDAVSALDNFRRSGSRYLMATTFPGTRINRETIQGAWRPLNLERPPFELGPPLEIINEGCVSRGGRYTDKSMGVWELGAVR